MFYVAVLNMTLVELIQSQMRNYEQEQKLSYEKNVMPAILSSENYCTIARR